MKKVWQALAEPTRREILELLKKGDMSAGEIAEHFETTAPTISHHLSVLKEAGLVVCERHAQTLKYSINVSVFEAFLASLAKLMGKE